MPEQANPMQYALVAYLRNGAGRFVEELRHELYPEHAHLAAHITVLPPRLLSGKSDDAIRQLTELVQRFSAFDVELAEVESFAPVTPTVFIRAARGAHRFRDMHVAFNSGALSCVEQWPYMPHLTIAKMPDIDGAQRALAISRERWSTFAGPRLAQINELTFVREAKDDRWIDVATITLRK